MQVLVAAPGVVTVPSLPVLVNDPPVVIGRVIVRILVPACVEMFGVVFLLSLPGQVTLKV